MNGYEEYDGLLDLLKAGYRYISGKTVSQPVAKPTSTTVVSEDVARRTASQMPVLRYGSRGETVKLLQRLLNKVGYNISVDGIFGKQTLSAVKAFQKRMGLAVDGIVGINTWTALFKVAGIPAIPQKRKPSPPPKVKPSLPPPPATPQVSPQPPPMATKATIGGGIFDLLMKNWLWVALAGSIILTTFILIRKR